MRFTPALASASAMYSAAVLLIPLPPANRRNRGSLIGVGFQDAQVRNRVCHPKPIAAADPPWRDRMHFLAVHFRDSQFGRPRPYVNDREIVSKGHRQFVDRRRLVKSGAQ